MAQQQITIEQVRHVAKLARLEMPEAELARFTQQLESILEYVAKLAQLDVSGVEPTSHALPLSNVLRDDVVEPPLPLELTLRNAPEADGPFFSVPKIIGGGDEE
jgi:aspartyl-tRNA(Asn)/glutamyl-tRNA(Gln) amidotransferase subunit C